MIKQGDIVASDGRIATQQDGNKRYITIEAGLVLDTGPEGITVNPVGKNAVLLCQPDDLHIAKAAAEQAKPEPTGSLSLKGLVSAEKAVSEPAPPPAKKAAPTRRTPAKKPTPRLRRTS